MKLKKVKELILGIVVLSAVLLLTGCQKEVPVSKELEATVQFLDEGSCVLPYKNGAINVDPRLVRFITVTFSEKMDRDYFDFIRFNSTQYDYTSSGWYMDNACYFTVDLSYNTEYKFVFNDNTFTSETYTKEKSYLRSKKGEFIERLPIEFKTINYDRTDPKEFYIDLEDFTVNFNDNRDYYPNSQQYTFTNLKYYLNHEVLIPGDVVKIYYDITSPYKLNKVRANLFDISVGDTWKSLNSNRDIILAENLSPNTSKTGTLEFIIDTPMSKNLSLQLYDTDYYDESCQLLSIDFN